MKRLITTLLFILLTPLASIACSCDVYSFCHSMANHPDYNVFSAYVISHDPNSIKAVIIDVLSGTETRDTIIVWDQEGSCMASEIKQASTIGSIGDTAVVSLGLIDGTNLHNAWDVVGDYRMEYFFFGCHTHRLSVTNGSVYGKINAAEFMPYELSMSLIKYSEFKESWLNLNGNCADLTVSSNIKQASNASIRSYNSTITIKGKGLTTIYNLSGQRVHQSKLKGSTTIQLNKGIYLVRVSHEGRTTAKKVYLR
ncbi:MAG: T9SS type A sorting domain-containing protein [Flavobacteriales bacterium]|nr:T9SS type A sorting domain-containing protein [Flavobacteriales bacterium]